VLCVSHHEENATFASNPNQIQDICDLIFRVLDVICYIYMISVFAALLFLQAKF